jgi:hypothetical protein
MTKKTKLIVVALGVAGLLALSIAGVAFAAGPVNPANNLPVCGGQGWNIQVVSQLLGLTPAEIQAELQAGKSLVQIAATKSVTEQQLVDAILAPHKTVIQAKVTAGFLTQEQATLMLQQMETSVRASVNQTGTGSPTTGGACGNGIGAGRGMMGGWGGSQAGAGGCGGNGGGIGGGMMGGARGMMGRWGTRFSY